MPKVFQSINPFDQSVIAEHALMDEKELQHALESAEHAYESWRKTNFKTRSQLTNRIAEHLRTNKESCARIISMEMGKILAESRAEIEKCAVTCEYYAQHGEAFLQDEMVNTDAKKTLIAFQPIGAVFGIMPWNFPFWQVIRATIPTIMAGNVFLLKHAPNVIMCAKEIEKLFLEAGLPSGVFQTLVVDIDVTEKIIAHEIVQGVTLTGSEFAGASVAALAGKHIKKSVLELGGSDPLIVLEDADFERAAKVALQSRMQNAGQSCIASKRFIVLEKGKDEFLQQLVNGVRQLKQGNQLEEATTTGPMARIDLAEKLEQQEKKSLQGGAQLLTGGNRNEANFQPTLLVNVQPGIPAFDEEMFGPVAAIISAKNESEAIRLANKNRYGLGASVWTNDLERGERIAREINSGAVFINALVKSDARYPFGGVKKSGYGRELGKYGMHEFLNAKTIYIDQ